MLTFDFLFLVVILVFYLVTSGNKKNILIVFLGAMSGVLLSSFKAMFLFSRRIVTYSFSDYFFYILIRQSLLPCVILFALFFLLFKDDAKTKLEFFLPLELSFYMIYLPYSIVSVSGGLYSKYVLFIKPLIFAAMIFQCAISASLFYENLKEKKIPFALLHLLICIIYLLLPAFAESFFYLEDKILLPVILAVAALVVPLGFTFFKTLQKKAV